MTTLSKRWISGFTTLAFLTTSLVPLAPVYAGRHPQKHRTIHQHYHSEEPSAARPARSHRLTVEEVLQESVQTAAPSSKSWISDWLPGFVQNPLSTVVELVSSLLGMNVEKTTIDEAVASLAALPREAAHGVVKGVKYAVNHPGETLVLFLSAQVAAASAFKDGSQTQEERPMDALLSKHSERFSLIGNEFQINQITTGNGYLPHIAALSNSNAFVVWSDDQTGNLNIYGRVFTPNGTALSNEFGINQVTTGNQESPLIATLSNGNAFVVWYGTQTGNDDIYGRVFAPNGTALGNEFSINQNTTGNQQFSTIAALSNGNAFVVWQGTQTGNADIYGSLFAPNGTVLGNEFSINQNTTGNQQFPTIAALSNGNAFVVWQGDQSGNTNLYGRLFDLNGVALSNELGITQNTTGNQYYPSIAALSNGNAFNVWYSDQSGNLNIYGQIFDTSVPVTTTGSPMITTGLQTSSVVTTGLQTPSTDAMKIPTTSSAIPPYVLPLLLGVGGAAAATCLGVSLLGGCAIAGVYAAKKLKKHQDKLLPVYGNTKTVNQELLENSRYSVAISLKDSQQDSRQTARLSQGYGNTGTVNQELEYSTYSETIPVKGNEK